MKYNALITNNEKIAKDIYELTLELDSDCKPGQFININVNRPDLLLRRPISISDYENNRLKVIYRTVGEGTKCLSKISIGNKLDVLSPLGNGFPLVKGKNVLIVGCGMGVAPMLYLAKELSKDNNLTIILAYQKKELSYLTQAFDNLGNVIITTDDGSIGYKGNVLDYLKENKLNFDVLYACGPMIVLKNLDLKYRDIKEGYLSFESRMACGIGACYGCVINTKNGLKRVCKDGPIFKLGEVTYD
ncbi:MAG: dihydroorotate dehydrogenase electron transfer subunit [Acholeplasmatales bacterium]|nr:dihydroorotate dehydrogenase electron transfer subunit [Acholeplasmatales bacterium]